MLSQKLTESEGKSQGASADHIEAQGGQRGNGLWRCPQPAVAEQRGQGWGVESWEGLPVTERAGEGFNMPSTEEPEQRRDTARGHTRHSTAVRAARRARAEAESPIWRIWRQTGTRHRSPFPGGTRQSWKGQLLALPCAETLHPAEG